MNSNPIGIFDSGVGGLTLLQQLIKSLPNESFEYYADSGNCPYGSKTKEEIFDCSKNIMNFLINKGCKLIIIACNTITTNIIDELRKDYNIPIVGLEPGTKLAYKISKNKRIGILATEGTINGRLYNKTLTNFNDKAFYTSRIGHGLVELIEKDIIDNIEMKEKLLHIIRPMINMDIDTLVLGCTHYNYLKSILENIFPTHIELVDTTIAVTRQVERVLNEKNLCSDLSQRKINITTTGDLILLFKLIKRLDIDESKLNIGKVPSYNIELTQE